MGLADTNSILRAWLVAQTSLTNLVNTRIYCGKLPEGATLPAITFVTNGGQADETIATFPEASIQFNCWADDPIEARQIYRALYDALYPLLRESVTVGTNTYYILWTQETTHGIDLQDPDIPNYYRILSYWTIKFRA